MRFRRVFPILIVVLLVIAAIALLITLRKHAPPEAARLLPGANGFFYINLKWIRTFNATGQLPPVLRDPEYQKFVEETGFQFERDLDSAAFAIHYPESWGEGTAGSSAEPRFSEIFVGKFNSGLALAYLKKHATDVENYGGFDIYNIAVEGRTVRVSFLNYDTVAVSNHPDVAIIHGMIDRSRKLASPFGGPWLLRRYYREVPLEFGLTSLSFAILQTRPQLDMVLPGSISTFGTLFPKSAVVVLSARYLRALHLKAEAFTSSEADAQAIVDKVTTFLTLFRVAEGTFGAQGTDADVKAFFDSLKIERTRDRAVVTATVPQGFIKKAITEAPIETSPAPAAAPQTPAPPASSPTRQSKKTKKP